MRAIVLEKFGELDSLVYKESLDPGAQGRSLGGLAPIGGTSTCFCRWPAAFPLSDVPHEHGRHASLFGDWSGSVDDPAVQNQLRDVLTSAIDELPRHYRAAIVLRDVEGLSTAEVADALGITVPTAKSRAHRARLLLRKRLSTFMEIGRPSETEVPARPSQG